MAAREWWDVVKHEVRDMLVPGQAKRMEASSAGSSPRINPVRRQDTTTPLPSEVLLATLSAPDLTATGRPTGLEIAPASTTTPATTSQSVEQTPTTSLATVTATAKPSEGDTGEISVAAKAGIVIGALGGILVLLVLVWLVFNSRRKKLARRRQQIEDDEKINGPFADSAEIRPPAPNKAPRLSLRPVTQFLPNFTAPERRQSRGIALTLNPVSNSPLSRPTGGSAWERPTVRSGPNGDHGRSDTSASLHPNPFHDNHRLPDEPVSPISSMGSFDHRVGVVTTSDPIPEPVSPIFGDHDHDDDDNRHNQLGVASNLTRKTSIRKDLPKPLDLTKPPSPLYAVPPSPAGTEYSMHSMAAGQSPAPSASAAAIAAAGGPQQSTVHRVQLDFSPTLPDELGLYAGQLVRLLHEYDDGWALCIRLDRSQQGVVPRTCLSTRPVKPRPQQQQQPGGGNQRGGPPVNPSYHYHGNSNSGPHGNGQGRQQRPISPGGGFPPQGGWRGDGRGEDDSRSGKGDVSPAPGQAY
ncbi:hypothetical protein C8A01DRAFT_12483 [Parachaetomium inaequale]|uniref:SH3 domain-containing protein n=1 Tax=Parachaetomium inaequale TaxID=2588326 RepID=A0AAN6SVT1_9PEZI|nr:hypothetical protein C8A01DRAFT_12483 [Parachaetomium inaequale]